MNLRLIGAIVLILGILTAVSTGILKAKDEAYINVIIQQNNGSCFLEDGTCLHSFESPFPFVAGFSLAGAILLLGSYLLFLSFRQEKKTEKAETKSEHKKLPKDLDDNEKLLLDKLTESQGTLFQSELVEKTGFTKVKITRILDKLEGKGLIERKRRGMTNVVILRH